MLTLLDCMAVFHSLQFINLFLRQGDACFGDQLNQVVSEPAASF